MATTIQNVREVTNPQRMYEYEVEVLGSTSSGTFPLLTQRVKDVTIPNHNVETFEISYKGKKTQHSGRDAATKTVTINFWETEERDMYKFFYDWIGTINDHTAGGGVTKDLYKGEVIIRTYAADSQTVTGTNKLINAFPTELGDVSLDYTSSDAMSFAVTFTFDENILE